MRPLRTLGGIALAAVFAVAACGSSTSSPSASAGASGTARASASATSTGTAAGSSAIAGSATPSGSAAPSALANIPPAQLVVAGRLLVCSDLSYVPQEFNDDQGNPAGSDVEIAQAIASRLALDARFVDTVYQNLIDALLAQKCDIVVSAQTITAAKKKQVDMLTYFQAGQSFLVAKGNPQNIKTQQDLCGKAIAAGAGSTELDYLTGTGDFGGQGLSEQCTKASKAKINVKTFPDSQAALLALKSGQVDAYFDDSPRAGYNALQNPEAFELSGLTLGVVKEGISVGKDHPELKAAVQKALSQMVNDGTYLKILQKYGIESGNVFAK